MNGSPHATRLQLWLAPYRPQVESAFDSLTAQFEDGQVPEAFAPVAAHLLASLGAALGREKEIHPAIMEHAREVPDPLQLRMLQERPELAFTGGPLYQFHGSTPADKPNPVEWQLANVCGRADKRYARPLYRFYAHIAGQPLMDIGDRRFEVWHGATERVQ